jgi:hypothetical protein
MLFLFFLNPPAGRLSRMVSPFGLVRRDEL